MQIEFHYNGESRTKSLLKTCTIDDVLSTFKTLFDVKKMVNGRQDFALYLVNNDGAFTRLQNPSKELYNGAIIDIKCPNNQGQNTNDNNTIIINNNTNNTNNTNSTLNISQVVDETDNKQEYPNNNNNNININNNNNKKETDEDVKVDDDADDADDDDDDDEDDEGDDDKHKEAMSEKHKEENNNDEVKTEINTLEKETTTTTKDKVKAAPRYVVRLRGLPWSARESEISDFFCEENIIEIQIVFLTDGRASGEALVEFADVNSFQTAFLKNRHHIGHRYIEIFKSTAMEIDTAAGRAVRPPARPPKSQYVIRMRGLPYSATDEDVIDFFAQPSPTGIHLIKDDLGRPSGEGFVEFFSEVDAIAAMAKHRHHMGHRYIELFRSSPEELMRALGLTTGWYNSRNGPQPKSTCILMRGLPYSCTESDITKFFQEIDVTPIRIHRKADGAEAYVEFYCITDTDKAMTRHRNYIGRRYIELFRVTYEDMARTVGLPVANTNIPASALSINPSAANTAAYNQLSSMLGTLSIKNTQNNNININNPQQQPHTYPAVPTTHVSYHYQPQTQTQAQAQAQHHTYGAPHTHTQTTYPHTNTSQLLLSAANINALMTNPLVINQNQNQQQTQQPYYHQSSQPNSQLIINGNQQNNHMHPYQQRSSQQQYYQPQYYQ